MIPDYFLLSEWWHLKNTNRILNICTKTKLKGAIFISCTIPIKKWKTPPCRCSHSSPQVFQPVAILSSPGSYMRTAGSRLLSGAHQRHICHLGETYQSCFHLDLREISGYVNTSPGGEWRFHKLEGSLSWPSSMHLYAYTEHLCFSPCSSLKQTQALHVLQWQYTGFQCLSSNRHSEVKHITPPHLYIHDDSQRNVLLCVGSCDDTNCASFKFLGKHPSKLSLRLPGFLETNTSFVPALASSHSLEGRAGPAEIRSCKIKSMADQNPRLWSAE